MHEPLTATLRAPVIIGPAVALEYRNILVPVMPGRASEEAIDLACRLAAERGASIAALSVVVVPLDLPLDTPSSRRRRRPRTTPSTPLRAIAELYGVSVTERLVTRPPRRPGDRRRGDAAPERDHRHGRAARWRGRRGVFSDTVDFVLKHAPCRVMVVAGQRAA